ncbi:MAG: nitroreductase family protein [Candidatus Accumulibacter sp.]|jgi:hypothetical protein|nr:nitroreductase family protein [Accumulibacter sp.]
MKHALFTVLFVSVFTVTSVSAAESSVALPAPQKTGGKPMLEAVASRASASGLDFPSGTISQQDIATLLWSATGKNRASKWTIPFGLSVEPYVDIYVAAKEGVYRYAWQDHSLKLVADGDLRKNFSSQGFVATASHIFIFVTNKTPLRNKGGSPQHWVKWTYVATGAMTEQLYLVADSLRIGARYAETMETNYVRQTLNIATDEEPVCIFALGKR